MQKLKKVLSLSMDDTVVAKSLPDFLSFAHLPLLHVSHHKTNFYKR